MSRVRLTAPVAATFAIAIGSVLAFAVPAGAKVALQSESPPTGAVRLGNTASLEAGGAAVFTAVNVICQPGSYASLTVRVTQAVRNTIASGEASQSIQPCTGRPQSLRVAVTPTQRPFVRGVAFGQAILQYCPYNCQTLRDEHNIRIV